MAHINSETLELFKSMHQSIHYLLKKYKDEQTVTDEELVEELEKIKSECADMITDWKIHLGHD